MKKRIKIEITTTVNDAPGSFDQDERIDSYSKLFEEGKMTKENIREWQQKLLQKGE